MNNGKYPVPRAVVGVLIYNEKGEVFLAKCHKWKDKWVVPGGHVDFGETLEQCVKREVKEETNLEIDTIENISLQESVFSKEFHEKRHMIFINYCAKATSDEIILNEELQEYVWINPKKALKLDLNSSTKIFIEKFIEKTK